MREHTVTTLRALLSSSDVETLTALKEREKHKRRVLSERLSKGQLAALMKAGGDPQKIFSKRYWGDVAQLLVHGHIDPNDMKPLFSPKTASSLEKIGAAIPGVMTPIVKGLRGLKKIKAGFGDARIRKSNRLFDLSDKSFERCADKHPIGSHDYYVCTGQTAQKDRSGHSPYDSGDDDRWEIGSALRHQRRMARAGLGRSSSNMLTANVAPSARERRALPILSQELEDKILEFGNIKKLARAISKLKK